MEIHTTKSNTILSTNRLIDPIFSNEYLRGKAVLLEKKNEIQSLFLN